jgi:hypothetical protein
LVEVWVTWRGEEDEFPFDVYYVEISTVDLGLGMKIDINVKIRQSLEWEFPVVAVELIWVGVRRTCTDPQEDREYGLIIRVRYDPVVRHRGFQGERCDYARCMHVE